jgi:integrase
MGSFILRKSSGSNSVVECDRPKTQYLSPFPQRGVVSGVPSHYPLSIAPTWKQNCFPTHRKVSHANALRQIHGRLVRFQRKTSPRRFSHSTGSRRASGENASGNLKPQSAAGRTIARAAAEFQQAQKHNPNVKAALREIVAQIGGESPKDLKAAKIHAVVSKWADFSPHTRSNYGKNLRRFLEWLEDIGAAPRTASKAVPKFHQPEPRSTTATDDERDRLLANASPRMHFFLLLCADMGLRHRTATRIAIGNFDRHTRSLTFTTKGNVHQTLPVPNHIAAIINALPTDASRTEPIVNLLRPRHYGENQPGKNPRFSRNWTKLKAKCGVREELRVHDLRRTLAEDVWNATKDLRTVQAQLGHRSPTTTARYLANRVGLDELERAMLSVETLREQRTADNKRLHFVAPPPQRKQA